MNILEARRRTLGGHILKKTAQGNPAIATDSLARRYPGITMQGWTEQDGTPTPESPVPIVSAGTQNQETGKWEYEVEVGCGNLFNKGTANENKYIDNNSGLEYDGSGTYASDYINVFGFDNIRCTNTGSNQWMAFYNHEKIYISGKNGYGEAIPVPQNAMYARFTIINGFINTFSVNAGITLFPYTPYRPPQTVTLTADRPLTKWDRLEKRNGQWGWVYKSEEIESYTDGGVPGEYFSTTGQLSVGAQVWYETTEETFVPLSESEQEQMNVLYTFRPTTVLSNDCECNMSLTYKTKKSMVGGGNPYGLEIGGIAGGGGGYEFEATNRIRTDYIPFYSPDGSRTYTIVGNPYNIANSNAYDHQKNALGSYEMTAGAFTPPAGTWFIRISFSKPDNSDFTQEELNQLIRTFDIERS